MVKKNKKGEPSSNNNKKKKITSNPTTKRKRKQRTKTNSRKTKTKKDGTDHHNINENINDFEYVNKNVTVKKIMEDNINILNLQSNNNKKDEKDESNNKKAIIRTKAFAENHAQYLHVENGYRVDYTLSQSVWSIFQIHNETVNVWVHMLGACIFLYFLLSIGTLKNLNNNFNNNNNNNIFVALAETTTIVENNADSLYMQIEMAGAGSYKVAMERFRLAQITMEAKKRQFLDAAKESSNAMKQKLFNLKSAFEDSLMEMASSGKKLIKLQSDDNDSKEGKLYDASERFVQSIDHARKFGRELVLDTHEYVLDKNSIALWPMSIFIITAIYCMACSSVYHLFSSLDEATVDYYRKLDLAGISLLICSSPYPYIYYHICSLNWVIFYLTGFTAVSSFTFSFAFIKYEKIFEIHPETFRIVRTLGYIFNGLIFLIPISHITYGHYNYNEPLALDVLKLMIYEGFIYGIGSLFYVKGWPEVWSKTGRFDIFFSSHQIWHLTVLIACWIHYIAMVRLYRWRQNHTCPIDLL